VTPVDVEPREGERLLVFARDQPDYIPLPVAVDSDGMVTSVWEPTADELHALLCGGQIRLCVHTFDPHVGEPGHYLQPVSLDVLSPPCGMKES